ncbi:MAG: glycosyltransferase family 39 protein, partial [Acidobacteriota bacterium]
MPALLFLLALAVRLIHVLSIAGLEWFDVPLVDGINYFRTANTIASGDLLAGTAPFWQPPLYPYFLAALIALFGQRMIWIYGVQVVVGSLSCVMTWSLGRRVFSPAAGVWGGAITALYGPLIYFDAQPLVPVVHIALALAGILLVLRAAGIPGGRPGGEALWALAGLCLGLAAIATANLLLVLPVVALWTWRRTRPARGPVLLLTVLAALPVLLVAARNVAVSGEPVLISSNAGINLFIGNNPDYERTVHIRPGGEFEALAQQPENQGILSASGKSRYFARRALAFLAGDPGLAARVYLRKLGELIAGREVPRNEDLYGYREHSPVLRLLLWRAGVSFPFGLVAPLALAGMLISRRGTREGNGREERRRAGRRLLLGFLLVYAATILLFFPTGRYRLPLVPVLAVFAGGFLAAGPAGWRRPAALAGLAAGLLLFNLDALHPSERWPEEEALNRAYALQVKGRMEEARREYERALALDPRRIDPHNSLAVMAAARGDWE